MRLSIEVTAEQHRQIKTMAALSGMKMKDWVLDNLFNKKPEKPIQRRYNKATEKAMKDAELGRNLKSFKSTKELFKYLDI